MDVSEERAQKGKETSKWDVVRLELCWVGAKVMVGRGGGV